MCTNKRFITNPYTGERLFVNCGHCPSCLQQKANKVAQRIRSSINDDDVVISLTLTYDNRFIPYVKRSDVENPNCYELPIYRDFEVRRFKNNLIVRPCERVIATLPLVNEETGECIKKDVFFYPNMRSKDTGFSDEKNGSVLLQRYTRFFQAFSSSS